MTETLKPKEISFRHSLCGAFSMAHHAEIELSEQQAQDYAGARIDGGTWALSDHKLLYFFLDEYQQDAFRIRYAHMDFGVVPEQIDTKLVIHQIGEQALVLAQVS